MQYDPLVIAAVRVPINSSIIKNVTSSITYSRNITSVDFHFSNHSFFHLNFNPNQIPATGRYVIRLHLSLCLLLI
jgi:hypothetical protein